MYNLFFSFVVTILLSTITITNSVQAQTRERLSIQYTQPGNTSPLKNQAEIWLSERWFLDQDGANLLQLGIQSRRTVFDSGQALPDLWLIVPQAYWFYSINDTYSLISNLRIGAFSDLKSFSSQSVRIEGSVIVDKLYASGLTLGLGLTRATNFGRVVHLPILHIVYSFNDQLLLDAVLPARLELWYLPSKKLELGAAFNIVGSLYEAQNLGAGIDGVGSAEMNFGPAVKYQFAPGFYINGETGVSFARKLNLMKGNTAVVENKPSNTGYLKISTQWRF